MHFQLIAKNLSDYIKMFDKFEQNPTIYSAHFFPENKVVVYVKKENLSDFADLVKNLDIEINNPIANF